VFVLDDNRLADESVFDTVINTHGWSRAFVFANGMESSRRESPINIVRRMPCLEICVIWSRTPVTPRFRSESGFMSARQWSMCVTSTVKL